MNRARTPDLPPDVLIADAPGTTATGREPSVPPAAFGAAAANFFPFRLYGLTQGAYLLHWQPSPSAWSAYYGTMRIERQSHASATASGDLYRHRPYVVVRRPGFGAAPSFTFRHNPPPDPSAGIPILPRSQYHSYLRVTEILQTSWSFSPRFTMRFERHVYDRDDHSWTNAGLHTAAMEFAPAPTGYPSGAAYASGTVTDPAGASAGTISLGWVSPWLRTATIEMDRVAQAEFPRDNGAGMTMRDAFEAVDWDVDVVESDADIPEPSGDSWSNQEMHAAMLEHRQTADLDSDWRYYLLAVRQLDSTSRGIMFDAYAGDSNNIPREGAGISSHWRIPNSASWGMVRNKRFGTADAPYFRTAVHEIGHAVGLYHNTADTGFMNTTGTIASSPGTFPANIRWSFNADDARRLRHMPDPWVRPGMIPFGSAYSNAPISAADAVDVDGMLRLDVTAVRAAVPIGAPVRVGVTLTNDADSPIEVPSTVSLKSEFVSGEVVDPSGVRRTFRSIFRCVDEHETTLLDPGGSLVADMTLLRGNEGALFPATGAYEIRVRITWEVDAMPVTVSGRVRVMVTPPDDEHHAETALRTLGEPDLLLTLAIGGDHLTEGNAALDAALDDAVLQPHYAVLEAKRLGRRFRDRKADPNAALRALGSSPVVSPSEAAKAAKLGLDANKTTLKKTTKKLCETLARAARNSSEAEHAAAVRQLTDKVNEAKD